MGQWVDKIRERRFIKKNKQQYLDDSMQDSFEILNNSQQKSQEIPEIKHPKHEIRDVDIKKQDYLIQEGDTISEISKRSGLSEKWLSEINKLDNDNKIIAGDTLSIVGGDDIKNWKPKHLKKEKEKEKVKGTNFPFHLYEEPPVKPNPEELINKFIKVDIPWNTNSSKNGADVKDVKKEKIKSTDFPFNLYEEPVNTSNNEEIVNKFTNVDIPWGKNIIKEDVEIKDVGKGTVLKQDDSKESKKQNTKFGGYLGLIESNGNLWDQYKPEEKQDPYLKTDIPYQAQYDYLGKYNDSKSLSPNERIELESGINQNYSDSDKINAYKKKQNDGSFYTIDDKQNGTTSLYQNGKLVKTFKAVFGKNSSSDEMTITHLDNKGRIRSGKGNNSTPAGFFHASYSGEHNGSPAFMRQTQHQVDNNYQDGIPSSMHRRNVNVEDHNLTNGCTGLSDESLKEIQKITGGKFESYILPNDDRNQFRIRNGGIQFKSGDVTKTPSYNQMVDKPFDYKIDSSNMTDLQKNVANEYMQALKDNKSKLQKDLGINHDTFMELSQIAFGTLGNESSFGKKNNLVGNIARLFGKASGLSETSPDIYTKDKMLKLTGKDNDNRSTGYTQIRYRYLSDDVKNLLNSYGITRDSLSENPGNAAIATLAKLADEWKRQGYSYDKAISGYNNGVYYKDNINKNRKYLSITEDY